MSKRRVLSLALLFGPIIGCSPGIAPLSIDARLQESLEMLERAQSHEEWESSPFHPVQVFRSFEEDFRMAEASPGDLCQRLRQLSDPDLAVFAEAISGRGNRLDLPCRNELSDRLGSYTERMEQKMSELLWEDRRLTGDTRAGDGTFSPLPRFVNSQRETTVAHGDLVDGEFALTFDDGPHPSLTPRLLEILERYNVLGSFFLVGQNMQSLQEIVRNIYVRGHSLGTHSWSHPNLPTLSLESAVREIEGPQRFLSQLLGEDSMFFRFPYGSRSSKLMEYVGSRRWTSFLWNVDTLDWKIRDPELLLKKVIADLAIAKRGVILFHDIQPQTIAIMPNLLYQMKLREYRIRVLWPSTQVFPRPGIPFSQAPSHRI